MAVKLLHSSHTGIATHVMVIDKIIATTVKTSLIETNIDAILEDTGTTIPGLITTAQADLDIITGTSGVLIDDAAITEDAFDNTTAFPVAKEDAGATEIARTGADGDTLETLSDQIDDVQTDVTTIVANTGKVVYGSVSAGTSDRAIMNGSVTGYVEDEKL